MYIMLMDLYLVLGLTSVYTQNSIINSLCLSNRFKNYLGLETKGVVYYSLFFYQIIIK